MIADRKNALATLSGCLGSLALQAGLWLAVAGICLLGAVIGAVPSIVSNSGEAMAVGAIFTGMAFAVVGTFVLVAAAFVWRARRSRRYDQAFAPLGLTGRAYLMLSARQYHGTVNNRRVDAYFAPMGLNLEVELYVAADAKTRVIMQPKSAVGRTIQKRFRPDAAALGDSVPGLDHMLITASDLEWTRALLSDEHARAASVRLCAAPGLQEIRSFSILPDAVHLRIERASEAAITPDGIQRWLSDMAAVAETAEHLPTPRRVETPLPLETHVRTSRGEGVGPILAVVLLVLVGIPAVCGLMVVALSMAGVLAFQ